jgi:hypothetical protein
MNDYLSLLHTLLGEVADAAANGYFDEPVQPLSGTQDQQREPPPTSRCVRVWCVVCGVVVWFAVWCVVCCGVVVCGCMWVYVGVCGCVDVLLSGFLL